jgi:hypothetical protein
VPGYVLIAGGASGTKSTGKAQFYDPTTKKFSSTGTLNSRVAPCGLTLANSLTSQSGAPQTTAEIFDPGASTFTPTGSMNSPRAFHTATLFPTVL